MCALCISIRVSVERCAVYDSVLCERCGMCGRVEMFNLIILCVACNVIMMPCTICNVEIFHMQCNVECYICCLDHVCCLNCGLKLDDMG